MSWLRYCVRCNCWGKWVEYWRAFSFLRFWESTIAIFQNKTHPGCCFDARPSCVRHRLLGRACPHALSDHQGPGPLGPPLAGATARSQDVPIPAFLMVPAFPGPQPVLPLWSGPQLLRVKPPHSRSPIELHHISLPIFSPPLSCRSPIAPEQKPHEAETPSFPWGAQSVHSQGVPKGMRGVFAICGCLWGHLGA